LSGPGGVGELKDTSGASDQFGDLPPRLRDRILQARKQGFPKEYESYLENYYRRLAKEETAAKDGE
jgi:hypothetical protein